jgi:transcriptional regulator with XRE-family HTH domain
MDTGSALRDARRRAGLSQATLASRAGTSQATISAYESGAKQPSLETFERLLAVTGARLVVEPGARQPQEPGRAELARAGRTLADVLELAAALPSRPSPTLRYPRLSAARP